MKLLATLAVLTCGGSLATTAATAARGREGGPEPVQQGGRGALARTSPGQGPVLALAGLVPGRAARGTVDLHNAGDARGRFTLATADLVDTSRGAGLSRRLRIVVEDLGHPASRAASVVRYRGTLARMRTVDLGTLAPGHSRRYRFTAILPHGDSPGADDRLRGARSVVRYDWNARTV